MGQKYSHTQLPEVEKNGETFQLPLNSRRGLRMKGQRDRQGQEGKQHRAHNFILDFNVTGTPLRHCP